MIWHKKQTHRIMEQNRQHGNKPKHILSTNFQQGHQEHTLEKRIISSVNGIGKLDRHMQNNEIGTIPYTMYKSQLKMY